MNPMHRELNWEAMPGVTSWGHLGDAPYAPRSESGITLSTASSAMRMKVTRSDRDDAGRRLV